MNPAWRDFNDWALRKDKDGRRLIVPVVGTGFNAKAGVTVGWHDLLVKVRDALEIKVDLPDNEGMIGNTTLAWEAMVMALAPKRNQQPHVVERELLKVVAQQMKAHYPPTGDTRIFVAEFTSHGFADVISFNFDEVLLADGVKWEHATGRFTKTGSYAARTTDGTRVWYPHGAVRVPSSIQLGMRKYGTYVTQLEAARQGFRREEDKLKDDLFGKRPRDQVLTPAEDEILRAAHRAQPKSWISVAMSAPLVFIGMGMGREEWPLWWFLNQRARNHARRGIQRPVFVFMRNGVETERLRPAATLANLKILDFDTYPEGWAQLLKALDARRES